MGPAGRSAVQLPSRLSWIAIGGIAVHIAARVMAAAQPGDILTSRTVRDLIVGSDITLLDHGRQRLKGVEGTWQLFSAMQP
jgi:class 3 adenylate cyclase